MRRSCPGCAGDMERRAFARRPHGEVELDLCWACHAIWFDQYESTALAPAGVMELFEAIDAHRDQPVRGEPQRARCPACRGALKQTQDISGTNRFTYLRCERGDGRLTTFYQFLREKKFVRSLSPAELSRLRVHVKQVRCSSCGGPVDIERHMECQYCRAPLSIVDADAVKKTIAELEVAERKRRRAADPTAAMDAFLAGQAVGQRDARRGGNAAAWEALPGATADGGDLLGETLHTILGCFLENV